MTSELIDANIKNFTVGGIVARFHIPELDESLCEMFDFVISRHTIVVCFLGIPVFPSKKNPLNFNHRKQMIEEKYPNVIVLPINDMKEDTHWSAALDTSLRSCVMGIGQRAVLYGSQKTFIDHYVGGIETYAVETDEYSDEIRDEICKSYASSPELRAGVIQGSSNRYPTNFVTVDVAILDDIKNPKRILLGRKSLETKFRFIGGFSEPTSECLEEDAMREAREEASECLDDDVKVVTFPEYICSMRIKDWRYRGLEDQICTTLFKCEWIGNVPYVGNDDIEEVQWFDLTDFVYEEGFAPILEPYKVDNIVGGHNTLLKRVLKTLGL